MADPTFPSLEQVEALVPDGALPYLQADQLLEQHRSGDGDDLKFAPLAEAITLIAVADRERKLEPPLTGEISKKVQDASASVAVHNEAVHNGDILPIIRREYEQRNVEAADLLVQTIVWHGTEAFTADRHLELHRTERRSLSSPLYVPTAKRKF